MGMVDMATQVLPDYAIDTCEQLNSVQSNACFSNADCAENLRCQNLGNASCCILGQRGAKQVGEACNEGTGEQECASSLCFTNESGSFCSSVCTQDSECPMNLPYCLSIPFSGTDQSFCSPAPTCRDEFDCPSNLPQCVADPNVADLKRCAP
jgi:hypothetical protein